MRILNVEIATESKNEIIAKAENAIINRQKFTIFTPNPEILVYAAHHPAFQELLNNGDINLPDGVGLKIACFLKNGRKNLPTIIHGIDFMLDLCREAERHGWSVGLLGGMNGAAENTKNELLRRFPKLKIDYVCGDFVFSVGTNPRVCPGLRTARGPSPTDNTKFPIPTAGLDILFVALGSPKEQFWIVENKNTFPASVFMQVGGSFDILSGALPRAPHFLQTLGLEWLWRLILQPKRIFRQLRLVEFLVRCLFS